MADYDYIIVGAGSAGCVLANRLTADPQVRVLLLEAGGSNKSLLITMPGGIGQLVGKRSASNWGFESEDIPGLGGRSLFVARGRGLGGSSSINGMLYVRGHPLDYDLWAQQGLTGWSYADVLPYFKRSEAFAEGADSFHGEDGPLHVRNAEVANPLDRAFLDATRQAGLPQSSDFNGAQQEGAGRYQVNIEAGRRAGALHAFLKPALHRENLTVKTDARVLRVAIAEGRATGVRYRRKGVEHTARARREIALCAGALQTPQILMLSGIGEGSHLREHGIAVVRDLPGVGANLQDHLDVAAAYHCPLPVSLYSRTKGYRSLLIGLNYLTRRSGLGAENGMSTGAFLKSRPDLERPDLQLHFVAGIMDNSAGKQMVRQDGFSIDVTPLHPASRGRVRLHDADPLSPPRIALGLLAEEEDMRATREGFRIAVNIAQQEAFAPYRGDPFRRDIDIADDAALDGWIRANSSTVFHPVGTAAMGRADDPRAVVGSDLRVIGVDGLRVVDASVMPTIVSGNTNAPTMMIAEKAADMILGRQAPARAA